MDDKGEILTDRPKLPAGIVPLDNSDSKCQHEGFEFALLDNCTNAYRFTAIASVEKIAVIFNQFARYFPKEAFFILEYYPDKVLSSRSSDEKERTIPAVFSSPYLPTDYLLRYITPYISRMIHDGFVGFGIANNRLGLEFFYSEEKVLTFFTDNHLRLSHFLHKFQIQPSDNLVLPANFGHDHVSLLALSHEQLPDDLKLLNNSKLDPVIFGQELVEELDMYQVDDGLSFFLTRKEQLQIETLIKIKLPNHELTEVEFGGLLLDWSEFVTECEHTFTGDLWEYKQGLLIRDMIQLVIEIAPDQLANKITDIVIEPDRNFKQILIDQRKRLDPPAEMELQRHRFWYQGMVQKQGHSLRRDLIRHGWFSR